MNLFSLMVITLAGIVLPEIRFEARGAIGRLFRCTAEEILVEGPAGTGKSRGILQKLLWECETYPKSRVLISRKVRDTLAKSVLVTWEDHVLPAGHECLDGLQRSGRKKPYTFKNGSTIDLFGFDDREKIKSSEFDRIYINEANEITLEDWEYAVSRVRGMAMPSGQIIADCNPDSPYHWLNKRPKQQRLDEAGNPMFDADGLPVPKMLRLITRHRDNPRFWDRVKKDWTADGRKYIGRLQNMTGTRKRRLLDGEWASAEGAVFEDSFDADKHIRKAKVHDLGTRRIRMSSSDRGIRRYIAGKDWGNRAPGVLQVWALDHDGNLFRVLEIYQTNKTPAWWLHQAKRICDIYGNIEFICDSENLAEINSWVEHGIRAVGAAKGPGTVLLGIHALEDRLCPIDGGAPTLYFLENTIGWFDTDGNWVYGRDEKLVDANHPTSTEEEMTVYSYAKDKEGKPIKEQPPVGMYDHGIDAMRYVETYLTNAPMTADDMPVEAFFPVNPPE